MLDMEFLTLGIPLIYIKKALIVPLSFLKICLMVATEEEGTHDTLDAHGTQVIHAIEGIEEGDHIIHGGHITNGYS